MPQQITIERDSGLDVSSPKHGKMDLDNAPHVGGNTWAGGTGTNHDSRPIGFCLPITLQMPSFVKDVTCSVYRSLGIIVATEIWISLEYIWPERIADCPSLFSKFICKGLDLKAFE